MSLQNAAVDRAINMLTAVGAQFKIITADGTEYGQLEVVQPKARKTKVYLRPIGELHAYYSPFIIGMKPGEAVQIPFGPYEAEDVRGPLTAWCCSHWGKGNYMTVVNRDKRCVEVLRIA